MTTLNDLPIGKTATVAAVGGVHYDGLDQQGLRSAAHIEQQALAQAEDWAAELLP